MVQASFEFIIANAEVSLGFMFQFVIGGTVSGVARVLIFNAQLIGE